MGRGLHVIVKARPLSAGVAHAGVEMYTKGRLFTMTGAPRIAPIAAAPDEFAALAKKLEGQIKVPFSRQGTTLERRTKIRYRRECTV